MFDRTNLNFDSANQPPSNANYPNIERFAFTPVPVVAPIKGNPALLNSSV